MRIPNRYTVHQNDPSNNRVINLSQFLLRFRRALLRKGDRGANNRLPRTRRRAQIPHGKVKVLVLVKLFIASCTPSLYPSPESLMPPNGVSSIR
ncbi:hypothetical protein PNO31109_00246 [Pandoraea nosoerga]|uniref:Uncharacterized protein n=1 Tax=Pandoraea nosoerga TaxID=2508296 RepID=A0A5E4RLL7_9BURK|nr:hypothetical protein PNO31109_00246 [Pandoraea nosoerga]